MAPWPWTTSSEPTTRNIVFSAGAAPSRPRSSRSIEARPAELGQSAHHCNSTREEDDHRIDWHRQDQDEDGADQPDGDSAQHSKTHRPRERGPQRGIVRGDEADDGPCGAQIPEPGEQGKERESRRHLPEIELRHVAGGDEEPDQADDLRQPCDPAKRNGVTRLDSTRPALPLLQRQRPGRSRSAELDDRVDHGDTFTAAPPRRTDSSIADRTLTTSSP